MLTIFAVGAQHDEAKMLSFSVFSGTTKTFHRFPPGAVTQVLSCKA